MFQNFDENIRVTASNILKKMFQSNHFSICEVDKVLKLLSLPPTGDYDKLQKLHCVHWTDMPAGMPQQVMRMTLGVIAHCQLDMNEIDAVVGLRTALPTPVELDDDIEVQDEAMDKLVEKVTSGVVERLRPKGFLGRLLT